MTFGSILSLIRNSQLLKQFLLLAVLLIVSHEPGGILVLLKTLSDISAYLIDPGKWAKNLVLFGGRPINPFTSSENEKK